MILELEHLCRETHSAVAIGRQSSIVRGLAGVPHSANFCFLYLFLVQSVYSRNKVLSMIVFLAVLCFVNTAQLLKLHYWETKNITTAEVKAQLLIEEKRQIRDKLAEEKDDEKKVLKTRFWCSRWQR